ncbi:hypothetical protein C8R44DRAFT_24920 [Mycena epipterygia]|nr:hypothetical protein C8R44DRAFT_24920 [Mycena epipterygia]
MTGSIALPVLLSWCSERGFWLDKRLQVISGPCGVAVISSDATTIPVDSILVRIPRQSVLSVKSSPISDLIPAQPWGRGAQLSLALALSVELECGAVSPWSAYLQSLPRTIPGMPLLWSNHSLSQDEEDPTEWLKGTEAAKMLFDSDGLLSEIDQYFRRVAQPVYAQVFTSSHERVPSLADFHFAYCLVSSRAFLVDSYHGLAMVPIADAFNHAQENHVHLESDFDVCPECGSLQRCVHDDTAEPLARAVMAAEDGDDFYEMVCNRAIPPRAEVFNTYGETLSNAQLLVQYGFILDANEHDRLTWTLRDLTQFAEEYYRDSVGDLPRFEVLLSEINSLPWADISQSAMVRVDRTHTFCLNGDDATISHDLWLYFALLVSLRNGGRSLPSAEYSRNSVVVLLEEMLQRQLTLELHIASGYVPPLPGDGAASAPYGVILELARLLASLCRARCARTGRTGVETAELGDLLDRLPDDMTPTRMAISLAMTERSLLDSCMSSWEGLAEFLV